MADRSGVQARVRKLLEAGRYDEADELELSVPEPRRDWKGERVAFTIRIPRELHELLLDRAGQDDAAKGEIVTLALWNFLSR